MEVFLNCLGVLIVSILAVTPFVIWEIKKRNKEVEKVFAGRKGLNERDFYEKYFAEKDVPFYIVEKVRRILEDELGTNLSRLSADDDFSKNLNFLWQYDSMADVEIVARIEEEFEIKISNEEAASFYRTVGGIVSFVWRKVQEKNESEN